MAQNSLPGDLLHLGEAFDQITLNEANDRKLIQVLPLDLPGRRLPERRTGKLRVRLVDDPDTLYEVAWQDIAEVKLFEQLVLDEAARLVDTGRFDEAYAVYDFLLTYYKETPGLDESVQNYLWRHLAASYRAQKYDETLGLILELHSRNPQYEDLETAADRVVDKLFNQHVERKSYAAIRSILETLKSAFTDRPLPAAEKWQQRLTEDATLRLAQAKELFSGKRYHLAREACREVLAIWPALPGAHELELEIERSFPQVVVGVMLPNGERFAERLDDWASRRSNRLLCRRLVEFVGYTADGAEYSCPWGDIEQDEAGLALHIRLHAGTAIPEIGQRLTAYDVSQRLAAEARALHPESSAAGSDLFSTISVEDVYHVHVALARRHVQPEALLKVNLFASADEYAAWSLFYPYRVDERNERDVRYVPVTMPHAPGPAPHVQQIIERRFTDGDSAIQAMRRGEIDVLDRVEPWEAVRWRSDDDIIVAPYALPTVHVLIPNSRRPLTRNPAFRRALVYGIHRQAILRQVLFDGEPPAGCVVLSGPFPLGSSLDDPVGWAADRQIDPCPYEPRLALILATAARRESGGGDQGPTLDAGKSAASAQDARAQGVARANQQQPLVLAHPAEPLARLVCQAIQEHLKVVEIPMVLQEILPNEQPNPLVEADLLYAELAMWEPIVDAHRLLGQHGLTGDCSPYMALALRELDAARNWNDARSSLHKIHRLAHDELPVIPLWQTVNYFAYRKSLPGIGEKPVTLYQNVEKWTVN